MEKFTDKNTFKKLFNLRGTLLNTKTGDASCWKYLPHSGAMDNFIQNQLAFIQKAYTQGYQTIVWGLSVDEVFKEITANYAFASSTAMNFLNTRLGFSIDRVIHKRFTDSIAEEILRGLGYSHSPSLQSEGYWQGREMTNGTLVYQKAIAALIKMNELGLVYIDSHLSAPSSSFKTGVVITRAQYEQTWALIQYPFTYLTREPDVPIDGIYIYKGLALAIQAIENRGYRYIDGQGYVLAR